MRLVVDASIALKWFLPDREDEDHMAKAAAVADVIRRSGSVLFAPPHWMLEVIGVLARSEPQVVDHAIVVLSELRPVIVSTAGLLRRGANLSIAHKAHLFDTL